MKLRLILSSGQAYLAPPCPADAAPACRGPAADPARARRRIWDVSPETAGLVTGLLLSRGDLERLLATTCGDVLADPREDSLRLRLLVASTRQCALASAVERALDERSAPFDELVARWPLMRIADWWASERERVTAVDLAALLWRLETSPGPFLAPLALRVGAHLASRLARSSASSPAACRG